MNPLRLTTATQVFAVVTVTATLAGGCGVLKRDAIAVWDLGGNSTLNADTTTFTALVTRLDCSSGVTGDVNDPDIELADDHVVITFTVSPSEAAVADCQGNDQVPYDVEIPEPLGSRELVDGACTSTEANSTVFCRPDGVRYAP